MSESPPNFSKKTCAITKAVIDSAITAAAGIAHTSERSIVASTGSLVTMSTERMGRINVESGFTGLDTEKFRLPGKDEYKAPRNFREEILESLKQGVPPQMKEQIERYFKNLSE